MVHGAFGLEGDTVVVVHALELENLDLNEFQAVVDDMSMAVGEAPPHPRHASAPDRRRSVSSVAASRTSTMGIFSRLGTLIKSNLNDLISKAEDPEKMLNQIVLDMQNQLVEAKKQVAASIADEKRLKKQWDEQIELSKEWERKAMMAVRAGDDELAKEALSRKARARQPCRREFGKQWQLQKDAVDKLKDPLRTLNDKIEEAKRKKNILIARQKRAEAQKAIQDTMRGLSDNSAFDTFERMDQKVEQIEAEAEASTELGGELTGDTLQQKFKKLEGSHRIGHGAGGAEGQDGPRARRPSAGLPEAKPTEESGKGARRIRTERYRGAVAAFSVGDDAGDCRRRRKRCYTEDVQPPKGTTDRWHNIKTTRRRDSTA